MLEIYVDSSYRWQDTKDGTGEGEICIAIPSRRFIRREKLTLSFPGLRQLNNHFELVAIELGLKVAAGVSDFIVYSDSRIAIGWAHHPRVKWIGRDDNEAGRILEGKRMRIKKHKKEKMTPFLTALLN